MKTPLLTISLLICATGFFAVAKHGKYSANSETRRAVLVEEQICYGPTVTTENLHNKSLLGYGPQDAEYKEFANAAFRRYDLIVTAPLTWHFVGEPYVNFVSGEKSGFDWNNFPGSPDRFFITSRTPNQIVATCWAGSHAMQINLACKAVKD